MTVADRLLRVFAALEGWLYAPRDTHVCAAFRIGYATLLLINVLVWAPDLDLWFGEDGLLPYAASREVVDGDTLTLFAFLPRTRFVLWFCYLAFVSNIVFLGIGYRTRLQAACAYVWLLSFQHRHMMLFDAEDNVFRILGLCLVFMPAGARWSVDAWVHRKYRGAERIHTAPAWGMRLAQVQITAVYASTVCLKLTSPDWRGGDALYYIARLDDLFGRFPVPSWLFETPAAYHVASWAVLGCEMFIPVALWIPRVRVVALVLAASLHLGLDYAMNLFLFQWIMLLGLVSFLEPKVRSAFTPATPLRSPDPTAPAAPRLNEAAPDAIPVA